MKRILVVDNHPVILKFMTELLGREGYEVITAADGLCALDVLQTFTPDVIFVDLVMPNIDGKKLCQIVRRMRGFENVQIVILSGIVTEEKPDFVALGARACIAKGSFPSMARNILEALRQCQTAQPGTCVARTIMGEDKASPRITMKELLNIKRHFELIFERMAEGLLELSRGNRVVYSNPTAKGLIGLPEEMLLGMSFVDLFEETEKSSVAELLKEAVLGARTVIEHPAIRMNDRQVSLKVLPIPDDEGRMIVIMTDITERKKMETQLQQAQKLEAIGVLAGGIAHDFNNILTAILGNITLAKIQVEPNSKVYVRLEEAEKASLRARDLTQQLLTFSRGGAPIRKTARITEVIADACKFALRGSNVKCDVSMAPDLWPVEVDVGQISQVIHNLVINADQAMPDGGVIQVATENVEVRDVSEPSLGPGRYVKITIKDRGTGIPREHLPKIFDPYFTTKQMGSGLGLATVYSIVKNHQAHIAVESEYGSGTTFAIHIPASSRDVAPKQGLEFNPFRGKGRILVMDDEDMVRRIVGQMLSLLGYDADYAVDGQEAIDKYSRAREAGEPFDAVIMDLTIPGGMGGMDALKKLLEKDPQVKAIVSSGYSNDPIMSDYVQHGFKGVIVKPYQVQELSEVLRKALSVGD